MISISRWLNILATLGNEMKSKRTIYGWKSPVNEANTIIKSTCVGYVNLALQRAGLLPTGKYVHLSNGKLAGTAVSYIKAHKEIFTIISAKASPQVLGDRLHVGDICLYTVPHIQVYAGKNKNGTPLWYSLERSSGGIGKPAKLTLAGIFSYYSKRKIEYIIRLKFSDSAQTPEDKPAPARYKLKMAMNLRAAANANSSTKVLARIPQGAILTVIQSSGTWKKVNYCGEIGWVNCASSYATKV